MLSGVTTAALDLESLVEKAESVVTSLCNARPCKSMEQHLHLKALNDRLQKAIVKVAQRIDLLEKGRAEKIRQEGEKYLLQVDKTRASIIENNQVKNIKTFQKTIELIFKGPKDSALDSDYVKAKNKQTRIRCLELQSLNPDGVISWAAGMAPNVWTTQQDNIFEYLVGEIEPEEAQAWPSKITEILHVFKVEEFAQSQEYQQFLTAFDRQSGSEAILARPRKRRRAEVEPDQAEESRQPNTNVQAHGPNTGAISAGRQIDFRYSEAPIHLISFLGEPISAAIMSSQQWKWERNLGSGSTTDCLNALAPRNPSQDISMTLMVGNRIGMQLIDTLQLVSR